MAHELRVVQIDLGGKSWFRLFEPRPQAAFVARFHEIGTRAAADVKATL